MAAGRPSRRTAESRTPSDPARGPDVPPRPEAGAPPSPGKPEPVDPRWLRAAGSVHGEVAAAASDLAAVVAWAGCLAASLDTRRIMMLLDPGDGGG